MTAPTVLVAYVLAQAGQRGGMMHLSSQRDTGALNPVCGANPVRSKEINVWSTVPTDLTALCADCAAQVVSHPMIGSVEEGLAIMLGADPTAAVEVRLLHLPVASILVDEAEHRAVDEDSDAYAEFVRSVYEDGVLQPVTVRRTPTGPVLVTGRRRLAAAIAAGLDTIPALVRDISAEQAALDALTDNLHRADLDPIAQAHAYQRAVALLDLTHEHLADRLSVSRSRVSNTVRLLGLPAELQEHVASGRLSAAHGRTLLRFEAGSEEQAAFAEQILTEGMSSRDAEHASRAASSAPSPTRLGDVSKLLSLALAAGGLQDSKVTVTSTADRARVVLDVAEADLARVLSTLESLGHKAAA